MIIDMKREVNGFRLRQRKVLRKSFGQREGGNVKHELLPLLINALQHVLLTGFAGREPHQARRNSHDWCSLSTIYATLRAATPSAIHLLSIAQLRSAIFP